MVSILITSFLRPHLLQWNLFSLARQNIPYPFETIVLNDGLPDASREICRQFERTLHLKYVFTGQRNIANDLKYRVPGFALNIGAKISSGEVLIISCAEMFHINSTIELLSEPILLENKLLTTSIGMDDQDGSFLNYIDQHKGNVDSHAYHYNYPRLNTKLPFLMAVQRREYFSIGGYDEDFTGFAFDDNDFIDRLLLNGGRLCLTQAKTVHLYHYRHDTDYEDSPEYLHNKNLYLLRKYQIVRNHGKDWGKIEYCKPGIVEE